MFSLYCSHYNKQFSSIQKLVDDVLASGQDPNYAITRDGRPTGDLLIDYIV
tara:strand:- start:6347 stop:6499 length:153 start_codon:yes stop_codon:yes gene_type:complete